MYSFVYFCNFRYWAQDGVLENEIEPIIIHLGNDDDEEEEVWDEEEEAGDSEESAGNQEANENEIEQGRGDDRCVLCGGREEDDDRLCKWYGCDDCLLWYHGKCLDAKDRKDAADSLKKKKKWTCCLCHVTKFQNRNINDYGENDEEE